MHMVLGKEVKVVLAAAGAASAGTAVTGSAIDTHGYDSIAFVGTIATANAGNYLKAQQSEDDGVADAYSDLAGSKVIVDTDGDTAILEIAKPQKKWLKAVVIRAGANTATGDVYAVLYNSRSFPQVNDVANLVNRVFLNGPDEGTP